MKTGMIRKLDDVGRIVIPKEIRKYLNLQEGSPLEIGINDHGEVVLKSNKYDSFAIDNCRVISEELHRILDRNVLLVIDNTPIICIGEVIKGSLSASIIKIIEDNKTYFACKDDKTTIVPIVQNDDIIYNNIAVVPISLFENCGAIIVFDKKDNIDVYDVKFLELVARFVEGIVK